MNNCFENIGNRKLVAFSVMLLGLLINLQVNGQALSPRVANYKMNIILDVENKMIHGETELHWRNPSGNTVPDLQFHLYYNAFKNSKSTFLNQGNPFDFLGGKLKDECRFAYLDIESIIDVNGEELINQSRYISPDDDNEYDQTVLQVDLNEPVLPFESATFKIKWKAKIPQAMVRTGYNQDYYFFAQWFPKLGVYEPAGMRYSKEGGWNCHQYHSSGEYYGEFGNYDVSMQVPSNYIVASSGSKIEEKNDDDIRIYRFKVDDVIDFTWSCSPQFLQFEKEWKDVTIKLYTYPGHEHFKDRYFTSVIRSLEYLDKYVGEYPYKTISIVDPPIHGMFTGGMEYPTLISSISFNFFPKGIKAPETLVVHEFVHQYFMQMVSTHEQEEPWMDEGITSYYEGRILDEYYGEETSMVDTWGVQIGNKEYNRIEYWMSSNPKVADNSYKARDFVHGGYGTIAYNKTAMMMKTLEGILGQDTLDSVMKSYFNNWKFKHPSGLDFIQTFKEKLDPEYLSKLQFDIDRFFDEALYGSYVCDYKLASITNIKRQADFGYLENTEDCVIKKTGQPDSLFESKVIIHRTGEMVLPVDVKVSFEDGSETTFVWSGEERSTEFVNRGSSKIIKAEIDPERKLDLEKNYLDNIMMEKPSNAYKKYTSRFKIGIQHLLDLLNFFS